MDINNSFPSNYLKAADLQNKTVKLTIRTVIEEKMGSDIRPVLYFQGKDKGMVLNKTNAMTIAQMFGPETDNWQGGDIEVFPAFVDYQGKQVQGLRVRMPVRQVQPAQGSNNNWQAPQNAPARQPVPADAGGGYDNGFDDDIPFAPEWR